MTRLKNLFWTLASALMRPSRHCAAGLSLQVAPTVPASSLWSPCLPRCLPARPTGTLSRSRACHHLRVRAPPDLLPSVPWPLRSAEHTQLASPTRAKLPSTPFTRQHRRQQRGWQRCGLHTSSPCECPLVLAPELCRTRRLPEATSLGSFLAREGCLPLRCTGAKYATSLAKPGSKRVLRLLHGLHGIAGGPRGSRAPWSSWSLLSL
mmetsp:Transcript_18586/g.43675  ORF Transcript_18586/g.43675 Transcript_18586/m.43675 type:complete len:207 (-) Transcript_18586:7-627(-)